MTTQTVGSISKEFKKMIGKKGTLNNSMATAAVMGMT